MSNRKEDGGAFYARAPFLFIIVVLVVALVFLGDARIGAPSLNATRVVGLAVMVAGLIAVCAASAVAKRFSAEKSESAATLCKLVGVLICGIGALIVFIK